MFSENQGLPFDEPKISTFYPAGSKSKNPSSAYRSYYNTQTQQNTPTFYLNQQPVGYSVQPVVVLSNMESDQQGGFRRIRINREYFTLKAGILRLILIVNKMFSFLFCLEILVWFTGLELFSFESSFFTHCFFKD
jgi:hypothetical protein